MSDTCKQQGFGQLEVPLPLTVLKGDTQKKTAGLPPLVERTTTAGNLRLCVCELRCPGASWLSMDIRGFTKWGLSRGL